MTQGVCFVGAATAGIPHAPDHTEEQLHEIAAVRALAQAGLTLKDVDGFGTISQEWMRMPGLHLSEVLGLNPVWSVSSSVGGSSSISHVIQAIGALQSKRANCVLITYGSTQFSTAGRSLGTQGRGPTALATALEGRVGMSIASAYALAASAHNFKWKSTPEDLARIAVAARTWATKHPDATYREPISVDDVLGSPVISSPLHRLDCCVVSDGAGAVVLMRDEDARRVTGDPIWIHGAGEELGTQHISSNTDLTVTPAKGSATRAFKEAKMTSDDVSFAMLYDSFTITALLQLEDCGFCEKGEVRRFLDDRGIGPDGDLPINTDGGGLSNVHPGMRGMFLMVEAILQLRGDAKGAQLKSPEIAFINGIGGWLSSAASLLLSNQPMSRTV